jgi:very-short-patch-repair endonuclease
MPAIKNQNLVTTGFHLPYNPQLVAWAREMRKNPTPAEKKLRYEFFSSYKPRFLRQRPIDNYIADFYCSQLKLVIEIDGDSHFSDEGLEYDQARTHILEGYGLKVMRFTNKEVLENFDGVCAAIGGIPPTPLDKGGYPDLLRDRRDHSDSPLDKEGSPDYPFDKGDYQNSPLGKGGQGGFSGEGGFS